MARGPFHPLPSKTQGQQLPCTDRLLCARSWAQHSTCTTSCPSSSPPAGAQSPRRHVEPGLPAGGAASRRAVESRLQRRASALLGPSLPPAMAPPTACASLGSGTRSGKSALWSHPDGRLSEEDANRCAGTHRAGAAETWALHKRAPGAWPPVCTPRPARRRSPVRRRRAEDTTP